MLIMHSFLSGRFNLLEIYRNDNARGSSKAITYANMFTREQSIATINQPLLTSVEELLIEINLGTKEVMAKKIKDLHIILFLIPELISLYFNKLRTTRYCTYCSVL